MQIVRVHTRGAFEAYQKAVMKCYLAGEQFCQRQLDSVKRIIEDQGGGDLPDEWLATQLASEHVLQFLRGEAAVGDIVVEFGNNRFAFVHEPS